MLAQKQRILTVAWVRLCRKEAMVETLRLEIASQAELIRQLGKLAEKETGSDRKVKFIVGLCSVCVLPLLCLFHTFYSVW